MACISISYQKAKVSNLYSGTMPLPSTEYCQILLERGDAAGIQWQTAFANDWPKTGGALRAMIYDGSVVLDMAANETIKNLIFVGNFPTAGTNVQLTECTFSSTGDFAYQMVIEKIG